MAVAGFHPINLHGKQAEFKGVILDVFRRGRLKVIEVPKAQNEQPDLMWST